MLARGVRVGAFQVVEPLGAGGMGQVFRARDERLGRDVALKVLSPAFRLDAQRRARFEREARVLASLNHPNIATLYGVEEADDTEVLVLELVEGKTLAERIADGPIPLDDALAIAAQIAAALEAAHEHGIVHRDLKPDNVKLRHDGTVKVLDFGLAKVFSAEPAASDGDQATVTELDAGAGGRIMGTPAYMSPEQTRGLPVDKRADIWSFGCVLYEMLTRERAFAGERSTDVFARILEREAEMQALPPATPPAIRRLLRRCLAKDPRRRLRDIGDARFELAAVEDPEAEAPAAPDRTRSNGRRLPRAGVAPAAIALGALALAAVSLTAAIALGRLRAARPIDGASAPITRFSVPADVSFTPAAGAIAISADGERIAYVTNEGLFVRRRDRLQPTRVEALADPGAGAPFFSPDGQWVGFTDGQRLRKVPAAGGTAITIAESGPAASASWTGNEIVFANATGLFRIGADGGRAEALPLKLAPLEQVLYPELLPERRAVIYTVIPTRTVMPGADNSLGSRVEVLDLATGERRTLVHGARRAKYLPTGHLLYTAGETLYAAAFDAQRLEVRGTPVAVIPQAMHGEFAVSDEGTLAYPSGTAFRARVLTWVDRNGREEAIDAPSRSYHYPRLSPDGTRIALDIADAPDRDIWIWDLRRKTLERFTLDPTGNPLVAWDLDGQRLAFGSDRFGPTNLFVQAADGSGTPERLLASDRIQMPMSFAPDGRLIFSADVPGHGRDVEALSMDGSRRVEPILHSAANDLWAEVSPDGRWIAYDSDESGQMEVYVRPFPHADSGGRWQISSGGGRQPMWSHDGRELYYRDYSGAMLAVPVTPGSAFAAGPAVKLFAGADYLGSGAAGSGRTYDLSHDGSRFLMIKEVRTAGDDASPGLVVVLNWFEELERLVPPLKAAR
ncbi:MAG TPA: protein kinase [Gammaproteobacteria bacterium]|nr:protein kinase [Gammaproteobacteria bacterium]